MAQVAADPALWITLIVMGLSLILMIVIPILPGQFIIWLAALSFGLVAGWPRLGWGTFLLLTGLMLIAALIDEIAGWLGAKTGGASWPGIAIGFLLGLVGLLLFNAFGALAGAALGIAGYEYHRQKDWRSAFKAAGGYLGGLLLSLAVRFGIGVVMVLIFAWRVWS